MKKILTISFLILSIFLLAEENKYQASTQRSYRLVNSDELRIDKVAENYITQLTGNVDFFYGDVECLSAKATIFEFRELAKLMDDVHIIDDSLEIYANYAEYDKKNEILTFRDSVRLIETHKDGTIRTFDAEELIYNRNSKLITADKNVKAYDEREAMTGLCGYLEYNLDSSYGYMIKDPFLQVAGKDSLQMVGKKIEYFDNYKKIVVTFEVVVWTDFFKSMSDFLLYYTDNEEGILLGLPRIYSDFGNASAQEIKFNFEENKIKNMSLQDSCYVTFSSEEDGLKSNWLRADKMDLRYKNQELKECFGYDNVVSYIFSIGNKPEERMINKMSGKNLYLKFNEDREIEEIKMKDNVKGKYKFVQ